MIRHPIANYIENNKGTALKDIDQAFLYPMVKHIQNVQRITRIAPKSEHVITLLAEGLSSSYHITKMPREMFVDSLGPKLGGKGNAQLIYNAAVHTHSLVLNAAATGLLGSNTVVPSAVGEQLDHIKEIPDLATLFPGSLNFCSCQHCRSVYSPAAYFVDLLEFLRWTPDNKAFNILLARRPDLEYIKLNCENTNTLIPYIDLVNEILESYVIYKQTLPFIGLTPHPNDTTEGAISDELGIIPKIQITTHTRF